MSVIKPALKYPELITHLVGANNYSWLFFRSGEKKLLAKPISYLEGILPDFVRVHKTALINPAYVKSLQAPPRQKMAGQIELQSGDVFPVSRRRWQQVAQALYGTMSPLISTGSPASQVPVPVGEQLTKPAKGAFSSSLLLITDDEQSALLAKQTIDKHWPQYHLQITRKSTHLPELLNELSESERPALLLLDARTTPLERLYTLQRLKYHHHLCRIPVVLLVLPTTKSVLDGYQYRANSVVTLKEGHLPFTQAIERVCQFWLQLVALPGVVRVE